MVASLHYLRACAKLLWDLREVTSAGDRVRLTTGGGASQEGSSQRAGFPRGV